MAVTNASESQSPASAAARVLAIPELLEGILKHAAPLGLFALQRVDTTFQDVIARRLKEHMMLKPQPSPRLRLFRLTTTLHSRQLARAIYPLQLASVHTNSSEKKLFVQLTIADECLLTTNWNEEAEQYHATFQGSVSLALPGSWENIVIEHPGFELVVRLNRTIFVTNPPGGTIRLGSLLEACAECLKDTKVVVREYMKAEWEWTKGRKEAGAGDHKG